MIAVKTKHPQGWEHAYLWQISIEPFAFNITWADVYYINLLPTPESIFGKFLLCCYHIIPKREKDH